MFANPTVYNIISFVFAFHLRPLLISSCIFPEDERSESVCRSIIQTIQDKADQLDQWRCLHETLFGADHDIPSAGAVHLSKLNHSVINTDTCNGARLLSSLLADAIKDAVTEKRKAIGDDCTAGNSQDILILTQDCHNHLRNVWIGAVVKRMSTYLNELLASDLKEMDFRLRISTMFDAVLRAIDKEFSLPANYPKGHGDLFLHWLRLNHPGALLVPVQRTAGSRQDLAAEGAAAVYWNRRYVNYETHAVVFKWF